MTDAVSVFFWSFSNDFFEDTCEIVDVRDSAMLCNGLNLHIGSIQQQDAVLNSFAIDIFCKRDSCFFTKEC